MKHSPCKHIYENKVVKKFVGTAGSIFSSKPIYNEVIETRCKKCGALYKCDINNCDHEYESLGAGGLLCKRCGEWIG